MKAMKAAKAKAMMKSTKAMKAMKAAKPKSMKAMAVKPMKAMTAMKAAKAEDGSVTPSGDDGFFSGVIRKRPKWARHPLSEEPRTVEVAQLEEGTWLCTETVGLDSTVEQMITALQQPGCSQKIYKCVGVAVCVEVTNP